MQQESSIVSEKVTTITLFTCRGTQKKHCWYAILTLQKLLFSRVAHGPG
jgi:hypothetical protein